RARRPRRRPPLSPRPSSRPAPPLHRAPRSRCRRGSSRPRAADRCPPQSSPRRLPATASAPLSCPIGGPLRRPQARADSSSAALGRERGPSRRRQRRPVVTLKTTPPWLTGTRAGLLAPVAALIDGDASSEQQRPDSDFHLHALIPSLPLQPSAAALAHRRHRWLLCVAAARHTPRWTASSLRRPR
ncbi:unnamed protein product, partial [Urochloa humidicola]